MNGPIWPWALVIALIVAGVVAAALGLLFLFWRIWRSGGTPWRWPLLVLVGLLLLGAFTSLAQIVSAVIEEWPFGLVGAPPSHTSVEQRSVIPAVQERA